MKVSFLIAYDKNSPYQWSLPPLGIGYLSAYSKQHCWWLETTFHHKAQEVIDQKPDVVAVSSSTENFRQAVEDAQAIREALGVPIVLGGMHITSLPHRLPREFEAGVIGEGEVTFTDLVKLYHVNRHPQASDYAKIPGLVYHDSGQVVQSPPRDAIKTLDELPYPDRETIDKGWGLTSGDQVHMISSRGCPYRCSFCSSAKHWKTFRFFSAQYVADEIEFLRQKYNPEIVYFFDDLFVGHIGRWRDVVRIFRERGLHKGIRFRAYARVDLVTEEMAEQFDELNFKYIDFGFESNSHRILKYLTKTRVTPEVNQRAIDWLWKSRVSVGANFIIGSPLETREDLEETFQFALRNRDAIDRCGVGPLQPLPGTGVWTEAIQKGLVSEEMDWSRLGVSYDTFDFNRFPFMGESISHEDFMAMYTKFDHLAREINHVGQIRRLTDQRDLALWRARMAEEELARLKGSRVVRAALALRDWRQGRLATPESGASPEGPRDSSHGGDSDPSGTPEAGNGGNGKTSSRPADQMAAQVPADSHQAIA